MEANGESIAPPDIKEITLAAVSYEYSNNVPLKVWLRSCDRMIKHAQSYLSQNYVIEAFKLYYRFVDLIVNKLVRHPEVKKFKAYKSNTAQGKLYLEYVNLMMDLEPIMKECETLKAIIVKNHDEFLKEQQKLKDLYKLREVNRRMSRNSRASRGSMGSVGNRRLTNTSTTSSVESVDEEKLLKQLRSLSMNSDYDEVISDRDAFTSYPELPTLTNNSTSTLAFDEMSNNGGLTPQIPNLPSRPQQQFKAQVTIPTHSQNQTQKEIIHKTVNFTEGGSPLRQVFISSKLKDEFLQVAHSNTIKGLETCGILCGKLSRNAFFITYLIIPEQDSTQNTCSTKNEERLFEIVDNLDLFVLGWIHTHPTQSCFLSSVDLHTQNSYQIMLNEAIAIVCSPDNKFVSIHKDFGIFRLTDPPGVPTITRCNHSGFHPHEEDDLYVNCNRTDNNDVKMGHVIIRDGLPFTIQDLRGQN